MLPVYNIKQVLLHRFSQLISTLIKTIDNAIISLKEVPTICPSETSDITSRTHSIKSLAETDLSIRFFKA